MSRIYLSFDVETDGRSPANHSMISLGIGAFIKESLVVQPDSSDWKEHVKLWRCDRTFKVNISPIEGRSPCPVTYDEFWSKWPLKWASCQEHACLPADAMIQLFEWLNGLTSEYPDKSLIWVAGPASFDWQWLNYYYYAFSDTTKYKLTYSADCLSTLKRNYAYWIGKKTSTQKREFYAELTQGRTNEDPHDALADAVHQGWQWVGLIEHMASTAA